MSQQPFVAPRKAIKVVFSALPSLAARHDASGLRDQFDMCRVFSAQDQTLAINYGVIEHLMRPSAPDGFVKNIQQILAEDLAGKLKEIMERKDASSELMIRELEATVTESDLLNCGELPALQVCYEPEGEKLVQYQSEPGVEGTWPVVHLFRSAELLCLLYPSEVTFIDAYDPETGGHKPCLVTPLLIDSIVSSLFYEQKRHSCYTQTNAPRERQAAEGAMSESDEKQYIESSFPAETEELLEDLPEEAVGAEQKQTEEEVRAGAEDSSAELVSGKEEVYGSSTTPAGVAVPIQSSVESHSSQLPAPADSVLVPAEDQDCSGSDTEFHPIRLAEQTNQLRSVFSGEEAKVAASPHAPKLESPSSQWEEVLKRDKTEPVKAATVVKLKHKHRIHSERRYASKPTRRGDLRTIEKMDVEEWVWVKPQRPAYPNSKRKGCGCDGICRLF